MKFLLCLIAVLAVIFYDEVMIIVVRLGRKVQAAWKGEPFLDLVAVRTPRPVWRRNAQNVVFWMENAWPVLRSYASDVKEAVRAYWKAVALVGLVVGILIGIATIHRTTQTAVAPTASTPQPNPRFSLGKGVWIYALDRLEAESAKGIEDPGGQREAKIQAIVEKAKKYGLNYLIVRTSVHGVAVKTCPSDYADVLQDACHREGIKVWGYGRISAKDVEAEVERAKEVLRPTTSGGYDFDGYIFDAEDETYGRDGNVKTILSSVHDWLKATVPNKRLAYSSYGIPSYHSWFPRSLYNQFCHYAMPQLYWVSWRQGKLNWSLEQSLRKSLDEWRDCPLPVILTVQSYSTVKPEEMTKFLSGWDTGAGFNTFRWELTGDKQWQAVRDFKCGSASYTPPPAAGQAAPAKSKAKAKDKAEASKPAPPPAMPLQPTRKGDLSGLVLIIDPGHGGTDGGCWWKGPGDIRFNEAALTYPMSWDLARATRNRGAVVYLTAFDPAMYRVPKNAQEALPDPDNAIFYSDGSRVTAEDAAYHSRVNTAKQVSETYQAEQAKHDWKNLAWVSVHIDSTKGNLEGAHVLRKLSGSNEWADCLGKALVAAKIAWNHPKVPVVFTSTTNSQRHKGKKIRTYVLDLNPLANVALIETGFPCASGRDSWRLRAVDHRQRIVNSIADGLANFNNR